MKSVDFNNRIKLKDIELMTSKELVQNWIQRLRDYYISPAREMDQLQNGFASLILQMCAIDALASFVGKEKTVEQKIRKFCKIMINNSQIFQQSISNGPLLSSEEIEKATRHLYYQYRCGLVHNGFTLQVGEFAKKNEEKHIFLISYEINQPISTTHINQDIKAFVVNPVKFLTMLQFELSALQKAPTSIHEEIAKKILDSLKIEIGIAKLLG